MWSTAREIAAGDVVIVWMTRDLLQPLTITPNAVLHNKFGMYPHNTLIGLPYGSKVHSASGTRGFLYVLRPTPELWTLALPHRTQILYLGDIAFVAEHLAVRRGSTVVEAGTGSGSFSHSVARTVGSKGRLYSFEFHEQRAAKAREEFERHGMSDFVTLQHRNVCKDGFGDDLNDKVDAVFLDLPAPWEAIPHAKKALRKDTLTRICTFSPCIEQVLRTVAALNDAGFTSIAMYEVLLRPIDVSAAPAPPPSVQEAGERLKVAERRREEKRLRQISANREREGARAKGAAGAEKGEKGKEGGVEGDAGEGTTESKATAKPNGKPRKRKQGDDVDNDIDNGTGTSTSTGDTVDDGVKRAKIGAEPDAEDAEMQIDARFLFLPSPSPFPLPSSSTTAPAFSPSSTTPTAAPTTLNPSAPLNSSEPPLNLSNSTDPSNSGPGLSTPIPASTPTAIPLNPSKIALSKALSEVRGHTSYLTFASLVPVPESASGALGVDGVDKEGAEDVRTNTEAVEGGGAEGA